MLGQLVRTIQMSYLYLCMYMYQLKLRLNMLVSRAALPLSV